MKKLSLTISILLAISSIAYAGKVELGRFGRWDTYQLYNLRIPSEPNINSLCAARGFFQSSASTYKVIFAFYNTGLVKFFIEDNYSTYSPGFRKVSNVLISKNGSVIFSGNGEFVNYSGSAVKQIGFEVNVDFLKAVFRGTTLFIELPYGNTVVFDVSDPEVNMALGNVIDKCISQRDNSVMRSESSPEIIRTY